MSDTYPWEQYPLHELEEKGIATLGRGNIISKKDIQSNPGGFPIYSSSAKGEGLFGTYGDYMFDDEMITWSVDGGGNLFYRPRHKFSVTNVSGYMRLDTSVLDYRFAHASLALQHSKLTFDYQTKAHPSVIRNLYHLPIPPLPEQKKIAEILSGIDNAISIKKQARIDLEATREAICKELIQNRDWNEEKVGGLTTHMTNGFVGTATPHYRERGIRYLTSKNIRRDRIDPRKMIYISEEFHKANQKSSLSVGDVLMVQSGHIGTTAVVTDEYKDCNCHALILMRFNQEQLDPHYASLYFNSTTGRTRLSDIFVGSTVKHVNTGDLRKFKIPLPPLGVQKEIANRVNAIDRLLGQRGVQIEKLVILKQAISSDLLSGRKRVSI